MESKNEKIAAVNTGQMLVKSTKSEKFFYTLNGLGGSVFGWGFVSGFISMYYTNSVGISAAVMGTMMLIARLFDGFTDVVMGMIIEKTKCKFGKGRLYVTIGGPLVALGIFLAFRVPANYSIDQKTAYVYATYIFVSAIAYTIYGMGQSTMYTRISTDPKDASLLQSIFMGCTLALTTLIYIIAIPVLYANGIENQSSWDTLVVIFVVLTVAMTVIGGLGCHEKEISGEDEKKEKVPLGVAFKAVMTTKGFWILLIVFIASYIQSGMLSGGALYYATYVIENLNAQTTASYGSMVANVVPVLLTPLILRKVDRIKFMRICLLISTITGLIRLVSPSSLMVYLAFTWIATAFISPLYSLMWTMLTDLVINVMIKTGVRAEGFVSMIASIGVKVGTGLGSALVGWILAFGGYDGMAAEQPQTAIVAIIIIAIVGPAIATFVEFVGAMLWKVDKENNQLLAAASGQSVQE